MLPTLYRRRVEKIRLTGGEPLVRQDLHRLIEQLAPLEGLQGPLPDHQRRVLANQIDALAKAGLKRVNVSIDTLNAVSSNA